MSDKITLSYEGLKGEATKLDSKRQELDDLITSVMNQVKALDAVWSDKAAKDFIDKVENMKPAFQTFSKTLEGLRDHMNNVSKKYEELSSSIISAQKF